MSDSGTKPVRRKRWRYVLLACVFLLILLGIAAWYSTTESFQAMVRRRVVAELEHVTGGRVEVGSVHTIPFRLRVEVRDLTIHGLEQPNQVPYAHVGRFVGIVKLRTVVGAEVTFDSVILDHPVIHVIVYPDGRTNQPEPLVNRASSTPLEDLFNLSINNFEVREGELILNDQPIPLDFSAKNLSANLAYSLLHRRYDGELLVGKLDTTLDGYRPFAWTAEAHFAVARNRFLLNSFKATSGRSRLEASGTLENFRDPKLTGSYEATLDLQEFAAITRRRDLQRGILQVNGNGSWSRADFGSTGKLQVKGLRGYTEVAALANGDASAQFRIDPHRLTISQIDARLLGGTVRGSGDVLHWLSRSPKVPRDQEQRGTAHLVIGGLSLHELAAAFSTRSHPLNRSNLAGDVNGTVDLRWTGSPQKSKAELALDVVPPSHPSPGELPLNARLRAVYDASSEAFDVPEFVAVTRATQVRASGTLSSKAAARFSITTTDLDEWRPFLSSIRESERLPVAIHGRASFNGTATGKMSSLLISGNLQAQDFDSELPATSSMPQRQVHWDYLSADVQLSSRAVAMRNGVLRHGPSLINFDFNAPLTKGQFADTSPFTAHLNIHAGNLAEIAALAGYNHPVSGTLELSVHAGGTRAAPNGEGHLQLTNAVILGEPVQHLTSDIRFAGGEAELNNIQLTRDNARITGGATLNLASGEFRFNINGSNFDLLRIPQLQTTRVRVEGRVDFVALGSGTLQAPSVNAKLHVHDLTLDHERSGDFDVSVVTKGADMQVTGRSQFKEADLAIDGTIHARDDWPANINLHFNHLDVDSLLRVYLHGRITGHSAAAGDIELHGPLLKPHELNIVGNLSDFFADLENIPIRNDGPIRFSLTTESVNLQQLHLIGEGTDLAATGSMQMKGDRQLDLHARGRVNLHLIESFNPDFTSSGFIAVNMDVSGTMAQPVVEGALQVNHGNIAYIDLPSALSDINGSLLFSHYRLQVQTLTAHTGGGLVTFGGYATVHQRQLNFDLTVQGQEVRLRYPPGVSSTATADLRWVGTPAASILSGDITVSKLAMTTGFDFGAYLERAAQNSSLPQTNPLLSQIKLDVHIVTTPELQMQTAVVRLSGDADLRLRGTAGKPVLLGRADIIEGDVFFNGTKYRLERGDVTFTNPVTTTPVLDLQAATRVRDYDITLNLNGDLSKLNLTYRSEPHLPEADILALLALGRTQEESAQLQQNSQAFSQETSNAILAEALNATLSNRVQRIFGVSRIKVAPQGSTTETSLVRGPQVTIEQQVTSSLTLTYSTNVSQTSQQIIQVEYNLTRNVSLVGVRDQNGVVSFDVRIRQRKK